MDEPEPDTIRAAAAGDLAAFEALVRAQQPHVFRFLRHFLRDATLAEDVTQETFLRVYRKLPTFAFQSKFTTWTFQIARNAAIDAIRARDRRDRYEGRAPTPADPSEPARAAEVQAAIQALSEKLREALLVVEIFGLTYREAAVVLAVPEGTVKSRVFQARAALTRWIAAGDEHEGREAR